MMKSRVIDKSMRNWLVYTGYGLPLLCYALCCRQRSSDESSSALRVHSNVQRVLLRSEEAGRVEW